MPVKGLLAGLVVLLVLAGAVYWSDRQKNAEGATKDASTEAPKLVTLKPEEVRRVEVLKVDQPVAVIERNAGKNWDLTGPKPARVDEAEASALVSTITNLTWDRLVEEKAADPSQFGLHAPAVQVIATGTSGQKHTLIIGDETPTGGGYFAKLAADPRVFTLSSTTKNSLDKSWSDLRDKRLLVFDDAKLAQLSLMSKGQMVEFGKTAGGDWQIIKPRPLRADNGKVEELVRKLREARLDANASEEDAARAAGKFAAGARVGVASFTAGENTGTLEVRRNGEEYFARSNAVEGVSKVQAELGEALGKTLEDYRNRKLFDFGFSEPSKVSISDGERQYHFTKGGEKWWSNGKEMDAASVQSLIDKLRDLSATRFVESGFTQPVLTATVTSNEGKRVEKVLIAPASGGRFLAMRDGEPGVYEIDSARFEEIRRAAADVKAPPPPASAAKK